MFILKRARERNAAVLRQHSDGSPIGVGGAVSTLPVATELE